MKVTGRRFREDRDAHMLRYQVDRLLFRNDIVSVLGDPRGSVRLQERSGSTPLRTQSLVEFGAADAKEAGSQALRKSSRDRYRVSAQLLKRSRTPRVRRKRDAQPVPHVGSRSELLRRRYARHPLVPTPVACPE
jgi:hypothetical protein